MSKVSLAEQLGHIDDITDEKQVAATMEGRDGYAARRQVESLAATRSVLAYLMNHEAEFKAFMAGKERE